MKKKPLIVLLSFLLVLSMAGKLSPDGLLTQVQAAYTPDVSVNTEADLVNEVAITSGTTAATPKVIEITASFDITDVIRIPSGENVVLVSDGSHTLTTQGKWRHFSVSGADTSLTLTDGITLTNRGYLGTHADPESVLIVPTLGLQGTPSEFFGGGIEVTWGATFNMEGGTIYGCSADGSGGWEGGGIVAYSANVYMSGGLISKNFISAPGIHAGAGIYLTNKDSGRPTSAGYGIPVNFYMSGGEVSDNYGLNGQFIAGGVYYNGRGFEYPAGSGNWEDGGELELSGNAKIINNYGWYGIYFDRTDNEKRFVMRDNAEISGNAGVLNGGLVGTTPNLERDPGVPNNHNGTLGGMFMYDNAKIENNYGMNVGGIDIDGSLFMYDNSSISGNTGYYVGGVLTFSDERGGFRLEMYDHSRIDNNKSTNYDSGGIAFGCYDRYTSVSSYTYAPKLIMTDYSSVSGNSSFGNGGAVFISNCVGGQVEIEMSGNATMSNNKAGGNGGAIYIPELGQSNSGENITKYSKLTVTGNASFRNNTAVGDGGAIWTGSYDTVKIGADVEFSENRASTYFYYRDPAYDTVYAANITRGTADYSVGNEYKWTVPFLQGYNNYDINHQKTADAVYVTFLTNRSTMDTTEFAKVKLGTHQEINPVQHTLKGVSADTAVNGSMHPDKMPTGTPTRTNYIFTGWNTKRDGTGTTYTGDEIVWRDTNVYAQWEMELLKTADRVTYLEGVSDQKVKYTIKYELPNGIAGKNELIITDTYDASQLTFDNVESATVGTYNLPVPNTATAGKVIFTIDLTSPPYDAFVGGEAVNIVLNFTIKETATGTISNQAKLTYDGVDGQDDSVEILPALTTYVTVKYYVDTLDTAGYLGTGHDEVINMVPVGSTYTITPSIRDKYLPANYKVGSIDPVSGSLYVAGIVAYTDPITGQVSYISNDIIRVLYVKNATPPDTGDVNGNFIWVILLSSSVLAVLLLINKKERKLIKKH